MSFYVINIEFCRIYDYNPFYDDHKRNYYITDFPDAAKAVYTA